MSNENDYAIVTENLDLWYGDFQALEKVSLNLRSGIILTCVRWLWASMCSKDGVGLVARRGCHAFAYDGNNIW